MHTLSLKIPDNINTRLESEAKKHRNLNKSEIVRKAIVFYLNQRTYVSEPESFYTLSQDLCGSVTGPEDLSSNASHLEGYGE